MLAMTLSRHDIQVSSCRCEYSIYYTHCYVPCFTDVKMLPQFFENFDCWSTDELVQFEQVQFIKKKLQVFLVFETYFFEIWWKTIENKVQYTWILVMFSPAFTKNIFPPWNVFISFNNLSMLDFYSNFCRNYTENQCANVKLCIYVLRLLSIQKFEGAESQSDFMLTSALFYVEHVFS